MESEHPSFKPTNSLVKDLMTPTFLNQVSMHPTSQFMSIYATDSMPALVSALAPYEMVPSMIELWKLKSGVAGDSPYDAGDDLDHLTFDTMMSATPFGTGAKESTTVKQLSKLRETGIPTGAKGGLVQFPEWYRMELLNAIYAVEQAAGAVLGYPGAKVFHSFNNLLNPKMRKAARAKEATCRYPSLHQSH